MRATSRWGTCRTWCPFPATARVVCLRDPAILASADVRRLNVSRFGRDQAWRHLEPISGSQPPRPPPMQLAVRGSMVEVQMDLQADLAPSVIRSSGRVQGVTWRPFLGPGQDHHQPADVVWLKQAPPRAGAPCLRRGRRWPPARSWMASSRG